MKNVEITAGKRVSTAWNVSQAVSMFALIVIIASSNRWVGPIKENKMTKLFVAALVLLGFSSSVFAAEDLSRTECRKVCAPFCEAFCRNVFADDYSEYVACKDSCVSECVRTCSGN